MTQHQNNTKTRLFRESFLSARARKVFVFLLLVGIFLILPNIHPANAGVLDWADPRNWGKYLIYVFFSFFGWLTSLAAQIFIWALDANTFTRLMNDAAMYAMWRIIRDFCNLFFIVILLFSAFATIFQLEKYDYKKTLPTLIVMAILVNFSFPISRFIIDLSNVVMYFFAQNIFQAGSASNISESILSVSRIKDILLPNISDSNTSVATFGWKHLLAATVCMFLFGVSFLILALMLLVRMVALAILVIFSPIGFVGLISPAVRKFGSDWWDKLFKWSTYGPLAVMFTLIAVKFMQVAGNTIHPIKDPTAWISVQDGAADNEFIASVAFFAIPITLFWIAITSTQKYSSDMSGAVTKFAVNNAQKLRRFAQKQVVRGINYGYQQTGIPGGVKTWWDERRGLFSKTTAKENRELREAKFAGKRLGDQPARLQALERKRIFEQVEQNKKSNRPYADLQNDINKGTAAGATDSEKLRAHAAALTMADKEMFENTTDFSNALKAVGGDMDSVSKIIRKAPKDLLQNSDDLTKALKQVDASTSGASAQLKKQLKSQIIEKAKTESLEANSTQMKDIFASFGGDKDLENAFKGRLKKEGKYKALIEHEFTNNNPTGKSKDQVYGDILKGLNADDFARQSSVFKDRDFYTNILDQVARGDYDDKYYQEVFKKMKQEDRANWIKIMGSAP